MVCGRDPGDAPHSHDRTFPTANTRGQVLGRACHYHHKNGMWWGMGLDSWEEMDKLPAFWQPNLLRLGVRLVGQDDHLGCPFRCLPRAPQTARVVHTSQAFMSTPYAVPAPWHRVPSMEESSSSVPFPEHPRHAARRTAQPPAAVRPQRSVQYFRSSCNRHFYSDR